MLELSEDIFVSDVVTAGFENAEDHGYPTSADISSDGDVSKRVEDYSGWRRFKRSASRSII